MSQNLKQPYVAPTLEFYRDWQQHGKIKMDWLLQLVESLGQERVYFYNVELGSDFFLELNQRVFEWGLKANHAIHAEDFFSYQNRESDLEKGIEFTLILNRNLSSQEQEELRLLAQWSRQLWFVLVARKDWALRNGYRAFPHELRQRLFVDFPVCLYPSDPFYSGGELTEMIEVLERDFAGAPLVSFDPLLAHKSYLPSYNISHFSIPRKLTDKNIKLSLICEEPKLIKKMGLLSGLLNYLDQLELVVTRVAGQRTQAIPKIKSLATTRYWVHLRYAGGQIPKALVKNFSASQCSGDYILYVSERNIGSLEAIVKDILLERDSQTALCGELGKRLFNKEIFAKLGGFDLSLHLDSYQAWDMAHRYFSAIGEKPNAHEITQAYQSKKSKSFRAHFELSCLLHKYPSLTHSLSAPKYPRDYGNYQLSITRLSSSLKVLMHAVSWRKRLSAAFRIPIAVSHALRPADLVSQFGRNFFWIIRPSSYHGYWALRRRFQAWAWYFLPAIYRLYGHLWRLNPKAYPKYWQLRTLILANLWRIGIGQIGWFLFRVLFPLRKIYYFSRYQYQKRILGMHNKSQNSLKART